MMKVVVLKLGRHKIRKFVSKEDYSYQTDLLKGRICKFNWMEINEEGIITIKGSYKKGYAWDGCTPKINLLQITWGNFDGKLKRFASGNYKPYTYYASMIHDVLYQYKRCVPVTRKEADLILYKMLKEAGFIWAGIYYIGVRAFGWVYFGWRYKE